MQLPDNPYIYLAIGLIALVSFVAAQSRIVRRLASLGFWLGTIALLTIVFAEQGRYHPGIAAMLERLQLDSQTVAGDEVRVSMSPDGHFWVRARIGDVERRMLVDSGATITAISMTTATKASVEVREGLTPVVIQTANGTTLAKSATIERLAIGGIVARDLPVVVSPTLGRVDILGMNFLSKLQSWRVEGRTLILTPKPESTSPRDKRAELS